MSISAPATTEIEEVVPKRTRVLYGFGELGSQFTWTLVSSYLVAFYTDIALLAPATIATIMLIARIWDAVDDPIQGMLMERTRTKWGRFRPWMIFATPLLAMFLVLTFMSPQFGGNGQAKAIYAGVTYILLGVFYSAVNMTYGALAGVMTKSYDERVVLNWWRGIGGGVGQLILNAATMPLILYFSAGKTPTGRGYMLAALILGLASVPMFWSTAFSAKEVIDPPKEVSNAPLGAMAKSIFSTRPLLMVWLSLLTFLMGLFGRLGIVIFYVMNNMGNPALMAVVMSAFSMGDIAGKVIFPRFATKFGKKQMVIASYLSAAAILVAIFLAPASNTKLITALFFLHGLTGFGGTVIMSMVPDCIDYQEYASGIRSDGTAYAFISFSTKVAGAIGGAVGILILGWFGYHPGQKATPEVLNGISIAANLVPAGLAVLAAVPLFFYDLTADKCAFVRQTIDERGRQRDNLGVTTAAPGSGIAAEELLP